MVAHRRWYWPWFFTFLTNFEVLVKSHRGALSQLQSSKHEQLKQDRSAQLWVYFRTTHIYVKLCVSIYLKKHILHFFTVECVLHCLNLTHCFRITSWTIFKCKKGFPPPFQAVGECSRFNLKLSKHCTRTSGCASWIKTSKILTYSAVVQEGLNHACHRSNWQGVWSSGVFYEVKTNNFSWIFQHWTIPDSFELSQGMTQTPLPLFQLLPSSSMALFIVNRLGNVIYSTAAIADMLSAMQ